MPGAARQGGNLVADGHDSLFTCRIVAPRDARECAPGSRISPETPLIFCTFRNSLSAASMIERKYVFRIERCFIASKSF